MMKIKMPTIPILSRYLLRQFFLTLSGALLAFVALFLVFDFFDRIRTFIREGSTVYQALAYLVLKVPLIVQLTMPIAVLIATLMSVGRLSQLSEITAMRASGRSVWWIAKPLVSAGIAISLIMLVISETIVPWATFELEDLYHVDIRKGAQTGGFSRENFWYRKGNKFFTIGYYDSRSASLKDISVFEFRGNFELARRITAKAAKWTSPMVGWTLTEAVEMTFTKENKPRFGEFSTLPLIIDERPSDFYSMQRKPESLSYFGLKEYIEKLRSEGAPTTQYQVNLASKLSFPFVNAVAVLIAIPFGLVSARSKTLTISFVTGVSVGFCYHFLHAIFSAFGTAELLPITLAAWSANIVGLCIGGYFMAGAEFAD